MMSFTFDLLPFAMRLPLAVYGEQKTENAWKTENSEQKTVIDRREITQ